MIVSVAVEYPDEFYSMIKRFFSYLFLFYIEMAFRFHVKYGIYIFFDIYYLKTLWAMFTLDTIF